ncbi:DUF4265 domain-containing protein [Streptomyces sp. NPDC056708]|uniref:DUF4265 domain-containing protein n=1 Tax=Streptomyces sp. NPDC056708 TaxID=3345920 RepID=UPI00367DCA74
MSLRRPLLHATARPRFGNCTRRGPPRRRGGPARLPRRHWPPATIESLWTVDLGDGTVRLDNTPWFVRGVASDDKVKVEVDDEGLWWAGEPVRASDNCTIRLILLKDGGSAAARQTVLETFHRLGTTGQGIEQLRMVALDIPPTAHLPRIRKLLEHGETKGWWHWEEGCVTAARTATASNQGRVGRGLIKPSVGSRGSLSGTRRPMSTAPGPPDSPPETSPAHTTGRPRQLARRPR